MIIDSKGREMKLPFGDLKGTVVLLIEVVLAFFF